jgi:hypothetical protein
VFIGHFALGFAAKRVAPRVPLPVLFAAAQFADLLWPLLLALGLEQVRIDPGNTAFTPLDFVSYPYSHSLAMLVLWGLLFALTWRTVASANLKVAVTLALLVVSHWVLDFASHRPDLPIYPGSDKFGLGLWSSVPATILVETLLYVAGLSIYVTSTHARDGAGRWGLWSLGVGLFVIYLASTFGPPPPSITALLLVGIVGLGLLLVWSAWVDVHREPTEAARARSVRM